MCEIPNCLPISIPEGIPYRIVSNDHKINELGGTFVFGLNKPLILVADYFAPAERKDIARHEFIEWSRLSDSDQRQSLRRQVPSIAHFDAVIRQNRKLRKSTLAKNINY